MKPTKDWTWFNRLWVFIGVLTIGLQLVNIYMVFTQNLPNEALTFWLAIFVVVVWAWLIWLQLWWEPKRDARWKAEMDRMQTRHREIWEQIEKRNKK